VTYKSLWRVKNLVSLFRVGRSIIHTRDLSWNPSRGRVEVSTVSQVLKPSGKTGRRQDLDVHAGLLGL